MSRKSKRERNERIVANAFAQRKTRRVVKRFFDEYEVVAVMPKTVERNHIPDYVVGLAQDALRCRHEAKPKLDPEKRKPVYVKTARVRRSRA